MSIRSWLIKVMPKSILNGLKIRRDRKQLGNENASHCDVSNLAKWSSDQMDDIFRNGNTDEMWKQVSPDLLQFTIPNMTGGINPGDRRALYYLVSYLGVTNVLEIGTHIGASTIHIAAAVAGNAKRKDKQPSLTTVDIADVNDPSRRPWIEHGASHSPSEMIDALGYQDFVEFKTRRSLDFLEDCETDFDLIFLDGDHSALNTFREIPLALKKLKSNGVILLHDYFPELKPLWSDGSLIPGPRLAVQQLVSQGQEVDAVPVGKLPWTTKLGSHWTTLALLTYA